MLFNVKTWKQIVFSCHMMKPDKCSSTPLILNKNKPCWYTALSFDCYYWAIHAFLHSQLGLNFRFKNDVIKMCYTDVQNLKSEIHHRFNWSAQLVSCTDFDYMHDHHNTFWLHYNPVEHRFMIMIKTYIKSHSEWRHVLPLINYMPRVADTLEFECWFCWKCILCCLFNLNNVKYELAVQDIFLAVS